MIWIVKIPENDSVLTKETVLENLPKSFEKRAERYLTNESTMSYLVGRLLLRKALLVNGFSTSLLEEMHYSEHGKPSLLNHNFSISHSNWYASLVFGTAFSVGIDIEKKKMIDLKLFRYLFTDLEWKSILEADNSLERFYWFWVRKEALLKAAGGALKDLKKLEVSEHFGTYNSKRYYFHPFNFNVDFNGIVAMEKKVNVAVKHITIKDLLK